MISKKNGKKKKNPVVAYRVNQDIADRIEKLASKEMRSQSNMINVLLTEAIDARNDKMLAQ